ncbi:hypothetical protein F5Y13DRAFT_163522 [Hypoxylon sp. FL1857]|nr:hypothetical protein F5Y13DRAFT_163522 [Hypoxylon sp. FL1857]
MCEGAAILADRARVRSKRPRPGAPELIFHSRATGISFINQGGICGSFREHRVGRIL